MPSSGMSMGGGMPYPPIITTASLPPATQNVGYSASLSAINGFPPYSWTLLSGPPGMSLSVAGGITWTPTTPGTVSVTVNVRDSAGGTPAAPTTLSVTVATNFQITTTSPLPNAVIGSLYSTNLVASGGVPPYNWIATAGLPPWAILTPDGNLSGTPSGAETDSIVVQAQDSSVPPGTANRTYSLTVTGTVSPNAPQAIWPGFTDSQSILFGWWPPASGVTPDYYLVYRNGSLYYGNGVAPPGRTVPPLGTGVVPITPGLPAPPQLWFQDGAGNAAGAQPLPNSSTFTYYVTAVAAGVESPPSPSITLSTLAGLSTPTTLPTPPSDPATWPTSTIAPPVIPVGGTTWTPSTTAATLTTPGTGVNNATGCGLQYAFTNANPGDVIVMPAGQTFVMPVGAQFGITVPLKANPSNKWIYVISSQAPELTPGGTLLPWAYTTRRPSYLPFTLQTGPAPNATSATLASPWAGRTGWYPTRFIDSSNGAWEKRLAIYTNGSTTLTWSANHPIVNQCNTALGVAMLDGVTPSDIGSMCKIQTSTTAN